MPKLKKKKKSTLDALSRVSGLPEKEIRNIWIGVKENNALLSSCSFHIFSPYPAPNMSRKYICENCKGIVGAIEKIWYERGIEHSNPKEEGLV